MPDLPMASGRRNWTGATVISLVIALVVGPLSSPGAATEWRRGARTGLCAGTEIRHGSGPQHAIHTIVPTNGWLVDITGGPRYGYGHEWWDTSRRNIDGGGTGWVSRQQSEGSCRAAAAPPAPAPPPADLTPAPPPDRNSLTTTVKPVVGGYFRTPQPLEVFVGPDGQRQNTLPGGLVVRIKGGPRAGNHGRIWWDLSEEEWGGGTGWFTLDPVPPPTTRPAPTLDPGDLSSPSAATPQPTRPTSPQRSATPRTETYCYRVHSYSAPRELLTDQVGAVAIGLMNCGRAWDYEIMIGTWAPRDHVSRLRAEQWPSATRALRLPTPVQPGETIELTFPIKAPSTPGRHSETFRLVADWRQWMAGPDLKVVLDVQQAGANPSLRIIGASFSSQTVTLADYLGVNVTVRNEGRSTARTAPWEPGSQRTTDDVAPAAPRGTWRVGVECEGMSDPYDHQWRVGFSHDLAPGQQTTVTLYLRPTAPDPKTTTCWVGLVEEWVAWHQDRIAVTQITFGGGSARDPIRDTFQAHPQLNEALFWLSGFRIEDVEAVRNEPLLNAALIAGNAVPIGRLLTKGYRFLVRGGREVIVDPSMHIVASAGIRAEKGYVGELYGLAVASQREGFRPLAGWLHGVTEHGPDALGRVFGGRPAVIESKFNCADRIHPSHLKDEVTTPWLMRYAGRAGPAAGEFSRSIANGTIVKMLVVTRCGEQAIGIAADALARFDVAYEVSETGRVLKRYAP